MAGHRFECDFQDGNGNVTGEVPPSPSMVIESSDEAGYSDVSIDKAPQTPVSTQQGCADARRWSSIRRMGQGAAACPPARSAGKAVADKGKPPHEGWAAKKGRPVGTTGSRDYNRLLRELDVAKVADVQPPVRPWSRSQGVQIARAARAEQREDREKCSTRGGGQLAENITGLARFYKRAAVVSSGFTKRALTLFGSSDLEPAPNTDEDSFLDDYAKSLKYIATTRCGEPTPIPFTWAAEAQLLQVPRKPCRIGSWTCRR